MPAAAHSKRAKRENRRKWNQAERALRRDALRPAGIGIVQAAELAVEEQDERREREERPKIAAKRQMTQPALDLLLERGKLSETLHKAGTRLEHDWRMSNSAPRVVADYTGSSLIRGNGSSEVSESEAARIRFQRAIQAVGIECSAVVVHVCLIPQCGPYAWETNQVRRPPQHTGARLLREGLTRLAEHYGFL